MVYSLSTKITIRIISAFLLTLFAFSIVLLLAVHYGYIEPAILGQNLDLVVKRPFGVTFTLRVIFRGFI